MSLKNQVTRGLKWQAISIVGKQLLSLVIFTTLARLLDPASFGLVGLLGVYLAFAALLAEQGIGSSLIQRQDLQPEHLDTAFWFNAGCSAVLCLGTIAMAGPISVLMAEPRLVPLLRWSSLGLVISSLSAIHSTLFIKELDFRRPVIRTFIASAVGGLVGIGMALANCGVWALVGQQLSAALAGLVYLWAVSSYRPSARFSLRHLRELMNVGSSVFACTLIYSLSSQLDQLFIGRFLGAPVLGLYVIAGKFPELAKTVTCLPIAQVSLPALSSVQNDHNRMKQVIQLGMEMNALLSFAVFVGIAAIASDLIPFLFGAKWSPAAGVCSLLSIYMLLYSLSVFFYPTLVATGRAGRYVFLNIWQAIGCLLSCIVGVHYGVQYLVLGLILNAFVSAIPAMYFLNQRIGLQPATYCRPCLIPACASAFMVSIIWMISMILPSHLPLWILLASKISLGGAAYLAFVFMFQRAALLHFIDTIAQASGIPLKSFAGVLSRM